MAGLSRLLSPLLGLRVGWQVAGSAEHGVLRRDLLADGLRGSAGCGDIRIWPAVGRGDQAMYLVLRSPAGTALLERRQRAWTTSARLGGRWQSPKTRLGARQYGRPTPGDMEAQPTGGCEHVPAAPCPRSRLLPRPQLGRLVLYARLGFWHRFWGAVAEGDDVVRMRGWSRTPAARLERSPRSLRT
ncbi:SsgA family sporulation/cell division regulator [Streptomyces mirabilis]|uniref:SsgA family sporulation/cell division regulator n=1 Tax=Streptomyces mirabilis TaxID=68239 RepID=UPI003692B516